jgi:hypothetical protein
LEILPKLDEPPLLVIISMTKLDTYFSMSTYSLAKAHPCQAFNQNLVLLFVFSFSSFVQAKFGAFVRIFTAISFRICVSAVLFVLENH